MTSEEPSESNAQITFRDDAPQPELRKAAERSVATLVARAAQATARSRAIEAELTKLANGEAASGEYGRIDPAAEAQPAREATLTSTADLTVSAPNVDHGGLQQFHPPYDFSWYWHDQNGSLPYHQIIERPSGHLGVDARTGNLEGGADRFVNAHAGFGLYFTTDRYEYVYGEGYVNTVRFLDNMAVVGLGGDATTEGGVEITVVEDGQLLTSMANKLWHRRISPGETAHDAGTPSMVSAGAVHFYTRPGRAYTVNVGLWAFGERHSGVGSAAAQGLIEGTVSIIQTRRSPL